MKIIIDFLTFVLIMIGSLITTFLNGVFSLLQSVVSLLTSIFT